MANSLSFQHPESFDTSHCIACQALVTDALDGSLGEIDQAWFDRHVGTCAECGALFADAQRGAAWLDVLKSTSPEPSADLMDRILAQTSLAQTCLAQTSLAPSSQPAPAVAAASRPARATVFPFQPHSGRQSARRVTLWPHLPAALFEPRLAMTAALALFSLALTMNLTGIQLGQLRPSSLRRTYYQSAAGVARYYDNLRVVRVLESRVDDLREENSDSDGQSSPAPEHPPASTHSPSSPAHKAAKPSNGISRRESPLVPLADRPKVLSAQAHSWSAGGLV